MTKTAKTRGPKEQALKAKREERALDIPAILKRQPETPEQAEARRAKQAKAEERKRFADSAGLKVRKPPEPVDPKIAKAIARDLKEADPVKAGMAKALEGKAAMAKALDKLKSAKPPIKIDGPSLPDGPGLARLRNSTNAEKLRKENVMATKTASKVAPKSEPKSAPKGKSKGPSKREIVVDMVLRKEGTTCAEACKKLGWQVLNRSTLLAYCKQAGVKVEHEEGKDGKPDRFYGKRKAA